MDLWEKGVGKLQKHLWGKTMRKRTLTVTCRYEPDELLDKCLSGAYEILIKRLIERKKKESLNKKEVEPNDNSGFVCKSFITEPGTEEYNREPNCRAQA
ncbi:hypothetical protein ID128_01380 [Candidatus Wolbachia massiliensis]|uniref:Uncharacterized protein n=2 Tax=Candidatus Wolbachia massiliensis TaxID=1845000 RepID=A0A7M3U324_9RICK|nr:hypothetical protein ID128_01380 [Candidatus Wolbachia massiliensis]